MHSVLQCLVDAGVLLVVFAFLAILSGGEDE